MMKSSVSTAILLLACVGIADAGQSSAARVRAFALLPNWTGVWQSSAWLADESGRPPGGIAQVRAESQLALRPPYNSEWATNQQAVINTALAAKALKWCVGSFPALMESPRMFQVATLPEETLLVFENGQIRHIYTDGRAHPAADDLWPTPLGDSVGHWSGDALIIDTVARTSSAPVAWSALAFSSMLSDEPHFIERLRLVGKDELEDQLTIEDPKALAKPWTVTLRFKRLRHMSRMIPFDCTENDRNPEIDGKIGIAPP